jgi:hypothetical protein
MMRLLCGIAGVVLLAPVALAGRDLSGLYDHATLEEWAPRYERSTTKIFERVIKPALLAQEIRGIGAVRLDFPLHGEGLAKEHPLQFYADAPRVVMPIASLKFLDDLCTAYAWLQINGYSLETISEYTAMLRYKNFPDGVYPRPLEALQIPPDALTDRRVDELALDHFVTARTFILLHELGHIFYRHNGSTIANEKQADEFAAEVMPRTQLPPLGSLVFFLFDAHWASYPPGPNDTHPMSGDRLRALAARVEDAGLANALRQLGDSIDDPEIREGFAATGLAANIAALAPRRPGELPRAGRADTSGSPGSTAFQGRFAGESSQFNDPEGRSFAIEVTFQRHGERVDGQYSFGLGIGRLTGKVIGDTLYFEWDWANNYGRGLLKANNDGTSFSGTWGYRESTSNAGVWNGRRSD